MSRLRLLGTMTGVELRLFVREPITLIFALAMPLVMLFVLGEVFGNTPETDEVIFRGVGAMDYYVPAYVGLTLASFGVLALPVHLAAYREHGVLRRFHASSVPLWAILGAQVVVMLAIATVGSLVMVAVAMPLYDTDLPRSTAGVLGAYVLSALSFAALGVLLGALLPTARAAQGVGIMLFFVMLMLGGAGPPPEVVTGPLRVVGDVLPLTYVARLLQDPWLGFGWDAGTIAFVAGMAVAAGVGATVGFRWE